MPRAKGPRYRYNLDLFIAKHLELSQKRKEREASAPKP